MNNVGAHQIGSILLLRTLFGLPGSLSLWVLNGYPARLKLPDWP
jgi:hypothetical protein